MTDSSEPRSIERGSSLLGLQDRLVVGSPTHPTPYVPPIRDGPTSLKPLVRGLTISVPWDDLPNQSSMPPLRSSSGISMNELNFPKLSRHASTDSHWSFTSDSDMMCLSEHPDLREEEIDEVVRLEAEVQWLQSELKNLKLQLSLLEEQQKEAEIEIDIITEKENQRTQLLAASLKELEQELDCTQLYRELEKKKNDELEATLQKTTSLKAAQMSLFISSPSTSPTNSNSNSPLLSPMTFTKQTFEDDKDVDDGFTFNTAAIANSFDVVKDDDTIVNSSGDTISRSPKISLSSQPVELSILMVKTMGSIYRRYAQAAQNNPPNNGLRRVHSLEKRKGLFHPERETGSPGTNHGTFGSMAVSNMLTSVANNLTDTREKERAKFDPYGTMDEVFYGDVGPYSNLLEVTFLPEDKEETSVDAPALASYKSLADELMEVDPVKMTHDERVAFWINLYNAITMHAYLAYGVPQTNYKRAMLMQKVTYMVGGMKFNILAMEYAVLRACSSRPALTGLPSDVRFKPTDVRFTCALEKPEPYVNFALCCGARSSPALRVFTAINLRDELHASARDFLQASIGISKGDKIIVPKILKWYCKDFASDIHSLLEWIVDLLPRPQRTFVLERLPKRRGGTARVIQVASFDWSFRYLVSPDPL